MSFSVGGLLSSDDWRVTSAIIAFFSWIFFNFMHYVLAPLTFAKIVPGWNNPTEWCYKKQVDLQTRYVAFWHSIIILPLALYGTFFDPVLLADKVWAHSWVSTVCLGISLGFFTWDAIICTAWVKEFGVGFAMHGISCILLYGFVVADGFVMYFALAALLFEASTPFLNIRFLLIAMKKTDGILFKMINVVFTLVFFVSRIVFGIACQYDFYTSILSDKRVAWYQFWACAPFCSALMLLNIYWFYAIVASLTKKRGPRKVKKEQE